jgi:hypothetical protein
MILHNSIFSPRRRPYPPAYKPYGLEAEPEALFGYLHAYFFGGFDSFFSSLELLPASSLAGLEPLDP